MVKRKFDVVECSDTIEYRHVMKKRKFDVEKSSYIAIKRRSKKKKRKFGVRKSSHIINKHRSNGGVANDPILESKHKIFLSHSGVQKEFVHHLCKALEDRCRYPFFDKRPESLPKGKQYPSLIIKAAQQCQLFVVVVSKEYFMSKWPMIELNAFVQASKVLKSNVNVAILPLFYGLYVNELKNKEMRQRWLKKWKTFAKDDPIKGRIKVEDWNFAVDELMKFNGLSYNRKLNEIVTYENEIVSHICTLVLPDIKWHDVHVQGNVHEVLFDKMKPIGLSQMYKVKVVGIYGVGGIGKTTTCKILCNKLSNEYEGRVCYVEFDSTCSNSKELLQKVVIKLTRCSKDFVCELDEGEWKHILHKNLFKQRTFLAIDNVSNNDNSIKQAQMFLDFPSHIDSLVLVTAQSQSILDCLGINGDACLEMPELKEMDAINLFLFYAAPGEQFTTKEDIDSIKWCVKYISKGDGKVYHYNPYELEVWGTRLRRFEEKPIEWKKHLLQLFIQPKKEDLGAHLQIDYPPPINAITRLEGIEWQYFSNVLQLHGLNSIAKKLNLKDMTCLRNLQVYKFQFLERLEGLESLKHLTCFEWKVPYFSSGIQTKTHIIGQFPSSLKYLYIFGPSILSEFNVLAHFNNLIKLRLGSMEIDIPLDLDNCSSLETTKIYDIISLQAVTVSTIAGSSRPYTLDIWSINGIRIQKLDQLDGLVQLFEVERCDTTWEVPYLLSLTKLQNLKINTFAKPIEQCISHQLQELYYDIWIHYEVPCLNAFKELQVLDLSWSCSLTQMYGMDCLPSLQSLNLYHCVSLERLPNLSKSKSLQELNLKGCIGLQLYVEDFEILATLPLLYCVLFSKKFEQKKIKLDINGRKVLRYLGPTFDAPNTWLTWKEDKLEKLVKIGNPEELEIIESNMEELYGVDSNVDNVVFDIENISKTHDIKQMTQGNSNLGILEPPFNCSTLFWFVVDHIKQFWIAKILIWS